MTMNNGNTSGAHKTDKERGHGMVINNIYTGFRNEFPYRKLSLYKNVAAPNRKLPVTVTEENIKKVLRVKPYNHDVGASPRGGFSAGFRVFHILPFLRE